MHKQNRVRNTGVPIQISEGVLDLLSKSTKNLCCVKLDSRKKFRKRVLPRTMTEHINIMLKVSQRYFCKYVLT